MVPLSLGFHAPGTPETPRAVSPDQNLKRAGRRIYSAGGTATVKAPGGHPPKQLLRFPFPQNSGGRKVSRPWRAAGLAQRGADEPAPASGPIKTGRPDRGRKHRSMAPPTSREAGTSIHPPSPAPRTGRQSAFAPLGWSGISAAPPRIRRAYRIERSGVRRFGC